MKNKAWFILALIALFMTALTMVSYQPKSEAKPKEKQEISLDLIEIKAKEKQLERKARVDNNLKVIFDKDRMQNQKLIKLAKENKELKKDLIILTNKLNEVKIDSVSVNDSLKTETPKENKKGFLKRLLNIE